MDMAKNVFHSIPLEKVINLISPYDLLTLLKKTNQLEYAYKHLKDINEKSRSGIVLQCYVVILLNKRDDLIELLETNKFTESEFETMFYLASDSQKYPLLLSIAEIFAKRYHSNKTKLLLSEAHSYLGHYDIAFKIMDSLKLNSTNEKFEYLRTLGNVARTKKIKIDKKHREKALKLINEIYFTLNKSYLSDLAYILIELGEVNKAKNILFDLAKDKEPSAQLVQDLIYAAGKTPWRKLRDWLKQRALSEKNEENKILWLKYLNETGNSDIAIEILEGGE
jgi:hypothetical protein